MHSFNSGCKTSCRGIKKNPKPQTPNKKQLENFLEQLIQLFSGSNCSCACRERLNLSEMIPPFHRRNKATFKMIFVGVITFGKLKASGISSVLLFFPLKGEISLSFWRKKETNFLH